MPRKQVVVIDSTPPNSSSSFHSIKDIRSSPPKADPDLPSSKYREAQPLPSELREHCLIYFEETLYNQALNLLLSILTSGGLPSLQLPALVAPPHFISLISTLTAHPTLTNRAKTPERVQASNLAWRYLRLILGSVGPTQSNLSEAFSFAPSDTSLRRSRRGRRKTETEESPIKGYESTIENDLASAGSIWTRGEDFWHVLGWALNCSVIHQRRWEVWRPWLQYMIDVLEIDWNFRFSEGTEDGLCHSIIVLYIRGESISSGNEKRILRALFADGQARSVNEFQEIWPNETKELKKEGHVKKAVKKIDIEADDYGDYTDDEAEEELEDGSQDSEQGLSPPPTKRGRRSVSDDLFEGASVLGGTDSIKLRVRILSLLSKVAYHLPSHFMHPTTLYELYLEHIRPLPLPTFFLIMSPAGLRPFAVEAASSLTQFILRSMLEPAAPDPPSDFLTQDILEEYYLPFAANKATVIDNSKVSLCVETLVRLLDLHTDAGLDWTPELERACERGIEARKKKARKADVDATWLDGSAQRIRIIVRMAQTKMTD